MDLLLSVSGDRYCLGDLRCDVGNVLYLALEDNERRLRKRIAKLLPPTTQWPTLFEYATEWPRAGDGGVQEIREWCKRVPTPRLVVVDVLAAFRSEKRHQQSPYEADYAAIKDLQQIASDFSIAIVVVHHTRKAGADLDRFDMVSGTLGLSGAADTALILDRDALGCRLYGRGRDIEEIDRVIEFNGDSCRWFIRGEASDLRRSNERETLIATLLEADEPMSPSEIADATGMPRNNVRQLLWKMVKDGEVRKLRGRGKYIHPDRSDLDPDNNDNNCDNDGGDDD
jgi:AAA domain/IclR helix-turn-helix domain